MLFQRGKGPREGRKQKTENEREKTMGKKNSGLNETVNGWFKREHRDKLWAIRGMQLKITFKDIEKTMSAGYGFGDVEYHSHTMAQDMMLNRLAELLGKSVDELIEWANGKHTARIRREYKAAKSPKKRKPDCGRIREFAESARLTIGEYASSLSGVDCVMLADALGKDGLASLKSSLCWINSQLMKVDATLGEARGFV